MGTRYYANAPATTLANSCSAGATSISVASVAGLPIQYPYTLIIDRGTSTEEVVSVTAASGTTLTVTRGYDSSTAFAHSVGASVAHGISAIDPREANAHVNATSGVHGLTGAPVGDTDAQTLTNKTLGSTNTINGFTASRFMQSDGTGRLAASSKAIPTGAVVGDTDAQTLTNKTLTTPTLTGAITVDIPSWTAATLQNSWVNFAGGYTPAQYTKIGGRVQVEGLIKSGTTTAGTLLFTLPVGMRPAAILMFSVGCSTGPLIIEVASTGQVTVGSGQTASATWTNLTLSFPAEA